MAPRSPLPTPGSGSGLPAKAGNPQQSGAYEELSALFSTVLGGTTLRLADFSSNSRTEPPPGMPLAAHKPEDGSEVDVR